MTESEQTIMALPPIPFASGRTIEVNGTRRTVVAAEFTIRDDQGMGYVLPLEWRGAAWHVPAQVPGEPFRGGPVTFQTA